MSSEPRSNTNWIYSIRYVWGIIHDLKRRHLLITSFCKILFNNRLPTKLREGNVFTDMWHSVWGSGYPEYPGVGMCKGWVCICRGMWGLGTQGVGIWGMGTHPLRWVCPAVGTHPPDTWDAMGYGWQVSGTHPTAMLSCSISFEFHFDCPYRNISLAIFHLYLTYYIRQLLCTKCC